MDVNGTPMVMDGGVAPNNGFMDEGWFSQDQTGNWQQQQQPQSLPPPVQPQPTSEYIQQTQTQPQPASLPPQQCNGVIPNMSSVQPMQEVCI